MLKMQKVYKGGKMITYKDLSWPLKIAFVSAWVHALIFAVGFIVGFVGAL